MVPGGLYQPENAPRTLESAEEPPVVQGNVVETVAAEKK